MNTKPQQRDLREHFEAILGPELKDLSDGEFVLRASTALWSQDTNGHITSREIGTSGDSTKVCVDSRILSVGGLTFTGLDGKAEFLLSDYHCAPNDSPGNIALNFPIILVATVQSQDPVFVTTRTSEVYVTGTSTITDVRIEIYTWESGGVPAKGQLVKWICQCPFRGLDIL